MSDDVQGAGKYGEQITRLQSSHGGFLQMQNDIKIVDIMAILVRINVINSLK